VVSTKVLTPFQAVLWAALFNSVAFWIFKDHAVANSISKTVYKDFITLPVIFSGLLAAIFWNLLTWWYGIPSSSSHTLIGGFAGAAIAHALMIKGIDFSWAKVVDSDTIVKTILFIFLAPIIGIIISIFISIVTIMRNIWWRLAIIVIATAGTVLMFDKFEDTKIKENVQKFYSIDKYQKEVANINEELTKKQEDSSLIAALNLNKEKLEKATSTYNHLLPFLSDFDNLSADKIAAIANDSGWLKSVAVSKLKDAVRNANDFLVLEAKAPEDKIAKAEYTIAKDKTEGYKAPLKLYLAGEINLDSALIVINGIYPIADKNTDNI
jgi:phosphate/sulfate permease